MSAHGETQEQNSGGEGGQRLHIASSDTPHTPPPAFGAETVRICSKVVDKFRTGSISRIEATFEILKALGNTPDVPQATVLQAGQAFIGMLDSWERSQRAAHERGSATQSSSTEGNDSGARGARNDAADVPAGRTATQATQAQSPAQGCDSRVVIGTKRGRALSADDSNDDDDERAPIKRALDLTDVPWLEGGEGDVPLSEPLEQTRRLILLFAEEPRRWKTHITNRRDCPQFPDSEWTNVIAGKAVNLDAVYAGMFSVAIESKHKEKIGRLSIAFDEVVPSKIVQTHGDWLSAWEHASAAITFVFKHRASELDAYRSHISQLFTVVGSSAPNRVISYDKGVRLRAGSRRDLLLTDVLAFFDLQTYFITAANIGSSGGSAGASGSRSSGRTRKRDACRRWNDGKCPNSNKDCNYSHCCAKCYATGHTAGACTGRA